MLDSIRSQRVGEDLITVISDRDGGYPICTFSKFGHIRTNETATISVPLLTRTVCIYGISENKILDGLMEIRQSLGSKVNGITRVRLSSSCVLDSGRLIDLVGKAFSDFDLFLWKEYVVSDRLSLQSSFDCFLKVFGSKTRRNIRYYMRKLDSDRFTFRTLELRDQQNDIMSVARLNFPVIPSTRTVRQNIEFLSHMNSCILTAIIDPQGSTVSIAGGWIEEGVYYMLFKYNSSSYKEYGLSYAHMGLLAQHLTQLYVTECVFLGSISGSLANYCEKHRFSDLLAVKPGAIMKLAHRTATVLGSRPTPLTMVNNRSQSE